MVRVAAAERGGRDGGTKRIATSRRPRRKIELSTDGTPRCNHGTSGDGSGGGGGVWWYNFQIKFPPRPMPIETESRAADPSPRSRAHETLLEKELRHRSRFFAIEIQNVCFEFDIFFKHFIHVTAVARVWNSFESENIRDEKRGRKMKNNVRLCGFMLRTVCLTIE